VPNISHTMYPPPSNAIILFGLLTIMAKAFPLAINIIVVMLIIIVVRNVIMVIRAIKVDIIIIVI